MKNSLIVLLFVLGLAFCSGQALAGNDQQDPPDIPEFHGSGPGQMLVWDRMLLTDEKPPADDEKDPEKEPEEIPE